MGSTLIHYMFLVSVQKKKFSVRFLRKEENFLGFLTNGSRKKVFFLVAWSLSFFSDFSFKHKKVNFF